MTTTTMRQQACAAPDCADAAGASQLMCDRHWSDVPPALRLAVERTWQAWRNNRADVATFQAHRTAVDAATRAVDPWHVDLAGWCLCSCHRSAGHHGDRDCACTLVGPADCIRCRQSIAVHAISPDSLHGDIRIVCPSTFSTWTPISGVTPPALRASMRDPQLELVGAE